MKAELVCPTHCNGEEKGRHETWSFRDGSDVVHVWLDSDGLHSKRFSANPKVGEHREEVASFTSVVAKSEGQKTLL